MNELEKLKNLTKDIDNLIREGIHPESEEFVAWKTRTERTLGRIFGTESKEYRMFSSRSFCPYITVEDQIYDTDNTEACREQLKECRPIFKVYIEELEEEARIEQQNNNTLLCDKEKQTKIFISHSSLDAKYVTELINLIDVLGVPSEKLVCTSVVGHTIPKSERIYDWIKTQFQNYNLHVIFLLSNNYYNSAPSLNEMGAAWALSKKYDFINLPGFSFQNMKGCIDNTRVGVSLLSSDDIVEEWFEQLKNDLLQELSLKGVDESTWRRHLKNFLCNVRKIYEEQIKEDSSVKKETNIKYHNNMAITALNWVTELGKNYSDLAYELDFLLTKRNPEERHILYFEFSNKLSTLCGNLNYEIKEYLGTFDDTVDQNKIEEFLRMESDIYSSKIRSIGEQYFSIPETFNAEKEINEAFRRIDSAIKSIQDILNMYVKNNIIGYSFDFGDET